MYRDGSGISSLVIKCFGITTLRYKISLFEGHLTINRASFPSILIICSTNTFESKFAFIE